MKHSPTCMVLGTARLMNFRCFRSKVFATQVQKVNAGCLGDHRLSACRHLLQYQAISSVWHERRFVAINLPEPHLVEVVERCKVGSGGRGVPQVNDPCNPPLEECWGQTPIGSRRGSRGPAFVSRLGIACQDSAVCGTCDRCATVLSRS